ncbi:MAG: acyl-CoA dehydrogenase family protein [Acidimicrobiales bacterium]
MLRPTVARARAESASSVFNVAIIEKQSARSGQEALVSERLEEFLNTHDPSTSSTVDYLGARFDAGLAWVYFPEGDGGLGVEPVFQAIVEKAFLAAQAPNEAQRNPIGYGMGAPTVVAHGTPEQRKRYLRPLFTGEEIWCQLFSEPGAGSDVAGLATRAVRDGDEWVVTGQKVWTTLAHVSRFGMLVARTNPDVPKHQGLTYFILDMLSPGVDIRPLRQITGDAEFNEVFLSEARIPDSNRLDAVGAGWRVSTTTLMNERVAIGAGDGSRRFGPIDAAIAIYKEQPRSDVQRERLMQLWVRAEANRFTNTRASEKRRSGTPGPEGSVAKLAMAELNKEIFELCVDLMGMAGTLYPKGYEMRRPDHAGFADISDAVFAFLRARANSIEGGTSEIMRNILGERVLGLPGEPRADKDRPWSEVPRN